MAEQNKVQPGLKDLGVIEEARLAAGGHNVQAEIKLIDLTRGVELTKREQDLISAARDAGFGQGVADGLQFVTGNNAQVSKMIRDQNERMDKKLEVIALKARGKWENILRPAQVKVGKGK